MTAWRRCISIEQVFNYNKLYKNNKDIQRLTE